MNRIEYEEKKYHESCYNNYTLFEEGSWLHKYIGQTSIELKTNAITLVVQK